ncbi:MAG: hypothetical protein HUU32_19850 [Calditrichaceae bacterium]|nr:hypothetical protein [Calditrichaceae bacterium]
MSCNGIYREPGIVDKQIINSKTVAQKILSYLRQEITLPELVDWAENVMMEGDFEEKNYQKLKNSVSRLGVADVKAFGLSWEDCQECNYSGVLPQRPQYRDIRL